jgi:hypothetical protein
MIGLASRRPTLFQGLTALAALWAAAVPGAALATATAVASVFLVT